MSKEKPRKTFQMPTTIAGQLGINGYEFLRRAEVVAISPDRDDDTEHFTFFKPNGRSSRHPKGLSELVKVIFAAAGGFQSLWIFNGPVPEAKVHNLAKKIPPGSMPLPSCSHAAWRHVAPITGVMHAVLWNGRLTLTLSPKTLRLKGPIHSMQGIFLSNGNLVLHIVCGSALYQTVVTPQDVIDKKVPPAERVKKGVNCILTVPSHMGHLEFIGTDKGLYFGDHLMNDTKGMPIRYISAATEIRRVFVRNDIGETWGFQVQDGSIIPPFTRVDGRRKSQLHFAGSTYIPDPEDEKGGKHVPAVMLSRIIVGARTKHWTHVRTLVELPKELRVPPQVALTL